MPNERSTIDAVRLHLEQHPAPRPPRSPPRPKITVARAGPAYQRASSILTRERFIQLYEDEHRGLKNMAAMVGVCRQTLGELARDYRISLHNSGGQRKYFIDRDWHYDEHVTKGRSLCELAGELGISLTTVANWAHIYDIPVRRLSRYDSTMLNANDSVPSILIPALISQGGWERLQRLPVIAKYRSLAAAAPHLRRGHSSVGRQVQRIERDLGGRALFVRSTGESPMSVTRFGKRVIDAVQRLSSAGGPTG